MRGWSRPQLLAAVVGAVAVAVVIGVPTGLIANPIYTRMTAAPAWSYAVWAATSVLSGLLIATYVRRPAATRSPTRVSGRQHRIAASGGMSGMQQARRRSRGNEWRPQPLGAAATSPGRGVAGVVGLGAAAAPSERAGDVPTAGRIRCLAHRARRRSSTTPMNANR
jgi:membrane protein implicated in regulation of membrane protease activity